MIPPDPPNVDGWEFSRKLLEVLAKRGPKATQGHEAARARLEQFAATLIEAPGPGWKADAQELMRLLQSAPQAQAAGGVCLYQVNGEFLCARNISAADCADLGGTLADSCPAKYVDWLGS